MSSHPGWAPVLRPGLQTASPRSSRRARPIRTPSSASAVSALFALPFPCRLLWPTPVLRLARMTELGIRTVLEQNIGAGLVEKPATETIAETRGGEPRRDPRLVHRIHDGAFFDQELDHPVPASVGGTEQCVFVVGGHDLRVDAHLEQEVDCRERLILVVDN